MGASRKPGPITHGKDFFDLGTLSRSMSLIPGPIGAIALPLVWAHNHLSTGLRLGHTLGKPKPKHKPRPARLQEHTDPKVWEALNVQFGTQVMFAKISQFEGGQWLEGYIPIKKKTGQVVGQSGLTIATGFDVGQLSATDLKRTGIDQGCIDILLPYAFLKKTEAVEALKLAKKRDGHGPVITKAQADHIDKVVKSDHLRSTRDSWDRLKPDSSPAFEALTAAQQTVLFSRTFHQGKGMPRRPISQTFYKAALSGDWKAAEQALRAYDFSDPGLKRRVNLEADLLCAP